MENCVHGGAKRACVTKSDQGKRLTYPPLTRRRKNGNVYSEGIWGNRKKNQGDCGEEQAQCLAHER